MMRKFAMIASIALTVASARPSVAGDIYKYVNKSYGYGFDVVEPLASLPIVPADGNDEEFATLQGHGKMRSWAIPLKGLKLAQAIQGSTESVLAKGYVIQAKSGDGTNWYEYSAAKDTNIILVRLVVVCKGGAVAMMRMDYPVSEQALYDAPLKVVRETMKPNGAACKN